MPRFNAQLAMKACVWSGVEQITALISFCSRHLRQSTYVLALGNLLAACAMWFSSTSHRATTFSLEIASKWASALPHVPIMATLSLLLGALAPESTPLGRMKNPAPAAAGGLRNWRH